MSGSHTIRSWFDARPHKWQELIGALIVATVVGVGAVALVAHTRHSKSWQAGRDYEEGYIALAKSRYSGSLLDQMIQSSVQLCDNVYLLADSEAGGQAYAGGEAAYNRDEWIAGCRSLSSGTHSAVRENSGGSPSPPPSTSSPETSPSPSPSPTSTGEAPQAVNGANEPNPLAQGSRFSGFRTPSGNIICWMYEVTDSSEPSQLECAVLSAAKTWVLPQTERVAVFPEVKTDTTAPVLAYGRHWSSNSLNCDSRRNGLTCRDDKTGHGFFLSREKQRVF